jgi:hypothetical protein
MGAQSTRSRQGREDSPSKGADSLRGRRRSFSLFASSPFFLSNVVVFYSLILVETCKITVEYLYSLYL